MKKMIFLVILVMFLIGCKEEYTSLDSGIVVNVIYNSIAGDFWNNPKKYTVITFKDERIVIYPQFIQRIHLNKCNEFLKNQWTGVIKAEVCQ